MGYGVSLNYFLLLLFGHQHILTCLLSSHSTATTAERGSAATRETTSVATNQASLLQWLDGWNEVWAANTSIDPSVIDLPMSRVVAWRTGFAAVVICLSVNVFVIVKLSFFPNLASFGDRVQGSAPKLAVIVPAHGGDLSRALASLSRWPTKCSDITVHHVELVLYYAGGADDERWSDGVLAALEQTGGKCFAHTSVLFGNLTDEVSQREQSEGEDEEVHQNVV